MASRGILKSPNFPSSYDPNTRCVWNIRGPIGHNLNFQFTNFDLPQGAQNNCSTVDSLQITETNSTSKFNLYFIHSLFSPANMV